VKCERSFTGLDLLGVHIHRAHLQSGTRRHGVGQDDKHDNLRAMWNAASPCYRRCPLWRCASIVHLSDLIDHLSHRATWELQDSAAELRLEGYTVINDTCKCEAQACLCPTTRIGINCPMCADILQTHESLRDHIDGEHLVVEHEKAHFQVWRQHAIGSSDFSQSTGSRHWLHWREWERLKSKMTIWCPRTSCGYFTMRNTSSKIDHQKSMLVAPAAIRPFHQAILKLYPDFITHPVWDDLV
jgi:hypothetical protein